jgi:hypothetical protein
MASPFYSAVPTPIVPVKEKKSTFTAVIVDGIGEVVKN